MRGQFNQLAKFFVETDFDRSMQHRLSFCKYSTVKGDAMLTVLNKSDRWTYLFDIGHHFCVFILYIFVS